VTLGKVLVNGGDITHEKILPNIFVLKNTRLPNIVVQMLRSLALNISHGK
jgi:hypothetical protein